MAPRKRQTRIEGRPPPRQRRLMVAFGIASIGSNRSLPESYRRAARVARYESAARAVAAKCARLRWSNCWRDFFAGEQREDRQFVLNVVSGDAVPKSVFKREHIKMLLFNAEQLGVRNLNDDFAGPHIHRQSLAQVEPRLDRKGAMELHPFGAAQPGVDKLVLDFHAPRNDRELADRRRLFEVNALVNGDARLKMRDVDECVLYIGCNSLRLANTLVRGAHRPCLGAVNEETDQDRDDQRHER